MSVNKEVITLHYGQAGIQIGAEIWRNLAYEANLHPSGIAKELGVISNSHNFFEEDSKPNGSYSPRACFIDGESFCIEEVILSPSRFHRRENCVFTNHGGSACYGRGKFGVFPKISEDFGHTIRCMVEACDSFGGFVTYTALGGGTGSGTAAAASFIIKDIFSTKVQNHFHNILPAEAPGSTVADYNTLLHLAECQDVADIRWTYTNEALYREINLVCKPQGIDVDLRLINSVFFLILSNITTMTRYPAIQKNMSCNMLDLAQNIVPLPILKLVAPAYLPLTAQGSSMKWNEQLLMKEAFVGNHELCSVDTSKGQYFTCATTFRNCQEKAIRDATASIHEEVGIPFADWCCGGFVLSNISITNDVVPPQTWCQTNVKSMVKISNHSSIVEGVYEPIRSRWDQLLSRRAFVYYYVSEGMEEGEFADAGECIESIIQAISSTITTSE